MRRITVDEVKAAYRKTGLRPKRFVYLERNCACAMGALVFATGKAPSNQVDAARRTIVGALGITEAYCLGFERGFDGVPLHDLSGEVCDETGYADGQACAAAVFGEGDGGE